MAFVAGVTVSECDVGEVNGWDKQHKCPYKACLRLVMLRRLTRHSDADGRVWLHACCGTHADTGAVV